MPVLPPTIAAPSATPSSSAARSPRRLGGWGVAFLTAVLLTPTVAGLTWWAATRPRVAPTPAEPPTRPSVDSVLALIQRTALDTVSADSLARATIRAALRQLQDPYAVYWTPPEYAAFTRNLGSSGLDAGITLGLSGRAIVVIAVAPGTPAAAIDLQPRDQLLAINEVSLTSLSPAEAAAKLRPNPAGVVTLRVRRRGRARPFTRELHLTPPPPPVTAARLLPDSIAVITLAHMGVDAGAALTTALDSLVALGARALVLDVRGNVGGYLRAAVDVSSLFLPRGAPVFEVRGRGGAHQYVATGRKRYLTLPLAVLIDRGTASAAEIVAGALQDHDRAALFGAPTYGKGVAQEIHRLPNDYAIKLTVSTWATPLGRRIQRTAEDGAESATGRSAAGRVLVAGAGIHPDRRILDTPGTAMVVGTDTLDAVTAAAHAFLVTVRTPEAVVAALLHDQLSGAGPGVVGDSTVVDETAVSAGSTTGASWDTGRAGRAVHAPRLRSGATDGTEPSPSIARRVNAP